MVKVLSLFHGNLNDPSVKVVIVHNDTDLSSIKLAIRVSKCFTKAQHFETLISNLIQDK